MHIDGTYGLEGPAGRDGASSSAKPLRPADPGKAPSAPDVEVSSSQANLIDAAKTAPEIDVQAVARAKELIRTGQLDTPEAARRAAQAIVDLGT